MRYSGRMWEYEFCGRVVDVCYKSTEYKSWRAAVQEVIDRFNDPDEAPFGWDKTDPDRLCSDLFYYVAVELSVEVMSDLEVFPAFNSVLDKFHRTDLLFKYGEKVCAVDLTCRDKGYGIEITPETNLEEVAKVIAAELH